MILQLLIPPTYTETQVPIQAGFYDIKIIRIDLNVASSNFGHLFIVSKRIPFKDVFYRPNLFPAGMAVSNLSRTGLFIPTRNFNGYQQPNGTTLSNNGLQECINFANAPLEFKNVFLDGIIDTQFFSAGTGNFGTGVDETPPAWLTNSRTHLILLDITPSKKI